jgi:UDP-N-acetylglucosamine/UDP-N-acetylgalactosamine 4-epimerase
MTEVAGKYTRCTSAINFKDFRPGDVQHSLADIGLAKNELNFLPKVCVRDGLLITGRYFCENG